LGESEIQVASPKIRGVFKRSAGGRGSGGEKTKKGGSVRVQLQGRNM